jgi:alkylation response protein AidB-like acyl-CoA dehydrogenase
VVAIFACFLLLLVAVYTGMGARALHLAVAAALRRSTMKTGLTLAQEPDVRRRIAEAALLQDGIELQLVALARDVDERVDHGTRWFAKLSGMKVRATETARPVVDQCVRVGGGSTYFAGDELGRLQRDVLAGVFHPSSDDAAKQTIATAWLGPIES